MQGTGHSHSVPSRLQVSPDEGASNLLYMSSDPSMQDTKQIEIYFCKCGAQNRYSQDHKLVHFHCRHAIPWFCPSRLGCRVVQQGKHSSTPDWTDDHQCSEKYVLLVRKKLDVWYGILLSTAKLGDNVLGSVRASVCLFVCALLAEPFDLWPWFLAWRSTLT